MTIGVKLVGKHSCDFGSLVLANSYIGVYSWCHFTFVALGDQI
jgi:hypothetical protein